MLVTAMFAGGIIGASIGVGMTMYSDYQDDGAIFNGSIGVDTYIGYGLGGLIAGAGIGLAGALGAAAGTATLVGSSATLFSTGGVSVTFGSAMLIGTSASFVTGMLGYAVRTTFNSKETFNTGTMFIEGAFNAASGALSVGGGYIMGQLGLRIDYASKLLGRRSDMIVRPIVQNIFVIKGKAMLSLLKGTLVYG